MRSRSTFFFALCLGFGLAQNLRALDAMPASMSAQPSPMAGLWAVSLGGDFVNMGSDDLESFYPSGSLSAPPRHLTPGFYLQIRKHVSETFFGLVDLSSLPKAYTVDRPSGQDLYEWDAVLLGLGGGWMLYHALNFGLSAQGEFGWLTLTQGSYEHTGTNPAKGTFDGSALATQFSLGGLWFVMPSVALEISGGYRFARLPLSRSASIPPPTGSAPEYYADLSGSFGRCGLSFFWGLRDPWGQSDAPPPPHEGPPADAK